MKKKSSVKYKFFGERKRSRQFTEQGGIKNMTDIEISNACKKRQITEIANECGIRETDLEPYGRYKAKIHNSLLKERTGTPDGKLILVTAITPTPAGEGKTTTSIGLADGLRRIGKKSILALREPSLGPVFGIKGGAAGGGYAQVVPMDEINLHFTGDFHAIESANNLLSAMIDNHIKQGNELRLDPERITWKRAMDMNDRALRQITVGLGGTVNGTPRSEGFDITVASEIMAIFCLASDLSDLKLRLGEIIIGYDQDGNIVRCRQLHAQGAMAALLKEAVQPNLVQTLEGTPALVHGGPFANIAHGCNSVIATRMAMKLADYTVTEAGFAEDLGAEKFFNIKCRTAGLKPDAVVMVATVRALKYHGGVPKEDLARENLEALEKGMPNLLQHIHNIREVYGLPCVVAINAFLSDTPAELNLIRSRCREIGVEVALSEAWAKGGAGAAELAEKVAKLCEQESNFTLAYPSEAPVQEKLEAVAGKIYHADGVDLSAEAVKQLEEIHRLGFDDLPVCIAKTQYSFSDDPKKIGVPEHFRISVRSLKVCAGAGFIVALAGNIMTMPGLPRHPAAENIDIDDDGVISGLF